MDDVRTLRRLYGSRTNAEIAKILGKSRRAVQQRATNLALAKDKRHFPGGAMPRWSDDELRLLRKLYPTKSNTEIAKRLGRSVKSVSSKGCSMGLKKDDSRLAVMGRENVGHRRDRNPEK
jgi:DNA-binding CsgD family transcriptional regulator